jgi:Tol biopolymer transport system component
LTRTIAALCVLVLSAAPAGAQYFGRNKVQYDRLAFTILQTPHFDIYYYPEEREAVLLAAKLAERWYTRLSSTLDHKFTRRQPIVLYASHAHFTQTSIVPDTISDGVGGFTDHLAGRVVLPFAAGLGETDHIIGHELVHAFQRDMLKKTGGSLSMLPLWFSEGMAECLSIGELDANTRMWLRDAAESDKLPAIAQLDDPKWFPYRYGQALWEFLEERYGAPTAMKALNSHGKNAAARLKEATGKDAPALSKEWHEFIRRASANPARAKARDDEPVAAHVIGSAQNGGRMNVAPALSPNGRYLVFLSERDGYSIDVYLADAATGSIIRKLVSTATDVHYESLQFIESAGAWNAVGTRFALATLRDGHPALTILDMPSGDVLRELSVPGVDQMFSPTWSPDGASVAFSALKGGFTDLFVVDVPSGKLRALTSDPYSDLQPAWSPDGKHLVFSTDRFSSSLSTLSFGQYQLATIDLASGTINRLWGKIGAKNIDPHWSPDGGSVYFVSDAGGASNVYRLDVASGRIAQVTDVATGVSGITALSPAMSIGRAGRRAAASVYRRGAYEIRILDLPSPANVADADDDRELDSRPSVPASGVLPAGDPADTSDQKAESFSPKPYTPRLSLAQLGSPYLSAGGGAFGSFIRAGVSLSFGDMLGQQGLETAVQVGKEVTDNAVMATYTNRRSRWNWAISGGQIPALVGADERTTSVSSPAGDTVVREADTLQQIHRQVAGLVAYPFNRAQRIEASVGLDAIAFDLRTTTTSYSANTGQRLTDQTIHSQSAPSATMIQTGAALVYDTALFGPASPILGQRYRLAIAPSFGDLHVLTTVADYRRYFMPARPFTLAFRVDGVARTGPDGTDPRLLPLVWYMPDFVRGFDTDSSTSRTSRLLVANGELRMPIPGVFHRRVSYGGLPTEAIAFADCGRFWMPESASGGLTERSICSTGAGVRLNAAGFVFEFDAVRPFGPLSNGWRLGINFQPGF